ncbi:MAG: UDPglucose--hexose-phosphate uridylyltransferase [Thermoleophilaceae bacterium]|nr:UDPglucose--hexose-phosphate uridylyltransferase [Thermoleophilaceae bacterium]
MPELRIDPLTGLRTIVAAERATRPGAGWQIPERPPVDPERDPFLEGHEDRTPPELFALRPNGGRADGPGWTVRVVPNLYPSLLPAEGEEMEAAPGDPLATGRGDPDLFPSRPATGANEVIVNAPTAAGSLLDLAPEQVEIAMEGWRERMRGHAEAAYVHVSVNEGREAGASLPHTHAQLYALSFVPAAVARERERFTAHWERTQGRNLLEDLLQEEVRRHERIVAIDAEAVAICPFASRVPFQVQLIPRRPRARFDDAGPLGARLLHQVLGRLRSALGELPPLNLWVRTAPRGAEHFCWRIDLLPRLSHLAGLELGTGVNLNVAAPERAAEALREAA